VSNRQLIFSVYCMNILKRIYHHELVFLFSLENKKKPTNKTKVKDLQYLVSDMTTIM
jgi:hypothetical protein